MKKDIYNFKINSPQPSSEDIAKHKDFDALLQKFQESPLPAEEELERKPRLVWLRYAAAAAAVALLIFFAKGIWTGGSNMTEQEYFASQPFVNPPLENIKPSFASQIVSANKGGVYEYENGSKLIVPAAAFVKSNGTIVEGDVDIKYREMHDFVDFFLSGIPMTYDSAGTQYILESAGMVEIYAEQDGERIQMQPGKEIKVELISFVDMPRLNVSPKYNIYKLNTSSKNWEYRDIDNIQIIEDMENEGFENEELNNLKINQQSTLARIETEEATLIRNLEASISMPLEPARPQKADSEQLSFDIDISENASVELRNLGQKYKNIIWHISPNSPDINPNALRVQWESMDLNPIDGIDYELTLINGNNRERVIVTPALTGDEFTTAMSVYQNELATYRKALETRESQLAIERSAIIERFSLQKAEAQKQYTSNIEAWKKANQDDPSINQLVRRKVVNRFIANEFGIWNCDRPLDPKDLEIEGNFVLDKDSKVSNETAYLVNKNRNTIVRIYAKDGAKVNFDQKSDNLMWMVTKDNQIAVFSPKEFKSINQKKDKHTFNLKVEPNALKSEEDVRKVLRFKEM